MTVAALVGTFAYADVAVANPERVLQSVDVAVGPDGSVTSVTSSAIRRSGDDEPRTDQRDLDPTAVADDLPVRLQVSWRLGEETGTDLRDLAGRAGRIVIDVTVQNTTVRPEALTYDSDGSRQQAFALVGMPLTVVASADLGRGGLSRVVTTDDVAPDQVTDGVLGTDADGASHVQWAALLAPPRLGASATFRLVTETQDFRVPRIAVDVQPGLVTDGSVERLLTSVFSSDEGSTVDLESDTIALVSDVNLVLGEAEQVLSQVRSGLDATAGDLGQQTIAQLQRSQADAAGSVQQLAAALTQLSTRISSALRSGNRSVLSELQATVRDLQGLLGDPSSTPVIPVRSAGGCTVPGLPQAGRDASLYERLLLVGAQMKSLRTATDACTDEVRAGLDAAVGPEIDLEDPASVQQCAQPGVNRTAVCALVGARADLAAHAATIATLKSALLADIDAAAVQRLRSQVDSLRAGILSAQDVAGLLVSDEDDDATAPVTDSISDLQSELTALTGQLVDISTDGVASTFAEIRTLAQEQYDALGDPREPISALGRLAALRDLADIACPAPEEADEDPVILDPTDPTDPTAPKGTPRDPQLEKYLDDLRAGCAALPSDDELDAAFAAVVDSRDAWQDILELSSSDVTSDLDGDVRALDGEVGGLLDQVNALLAGDSPVGSLRKDLRELSRQVRDLYDDGNGNGNGQGEGGGQTGSTGGTPGVCDVDADEDDPFLNQVDTALGAVECRTQRLTAVVDAFDRDYNRQIDDTSGVIGDRIGATDRARDQAANRVERLNDDLGSRIGATADRLEDESAEQITRSRLALSQQYRIFQRSLEDSTLGVIDQISTSVTAANRDLEASGEQLRADLRAVLTDLGSQNDGGTGVIGSLATNAARTGTSRAQIGDASDQAQQFGEVRTSVLDDVYLQRAQLGRSLELQQQFPAFGIDVAEGSRVLTVFNFRIGG